MAASSVESSRAWNPDAAIGGSVTGVGRRDGKASDVALARAASFGSDDWDDEPTPSNQNSSSFDDDGSQWTSFDGDASDFFSECESDFTSGAGQRRKFAEKVKRKTKKKSSRGPVSSNGSTMMMARQPSVRSIGSMLSEDSTSSVEESFFSDLRPAKGSTRAHDSQSSFNSFGPRNNRLSSKLETVIQKDRPRRARGSAQSVPDMSSFNKKSSAKDANSVVGEKEGIATFKSAYGPQSDSPMKLGAMLVSDKPTARRSCAQSVPGTIPVTSKKPVPTSMPDFAPDPFELSSTLNPDSLRASQVFYANKDSYRQRRRASFGSSSNGKSRSPDMDSSMRTPNCSSMSIEETISSDKRRQRHRSGNGSVSSAGSKGSKGQSVSSAPSKMSHDKNTAAQAFRSWQSSSGDSSGGIPERSKRCGHSTELDSSRRGKGKRTGRLSSSLNAVDPAESRSGKTSRRPVRRQSIGQDKEDTKHRVQSSRRSRDEKPGMRKQLSERRVKLSGSSRSLISERTTPEQLAEEEKLLESRLALMTAQREKSGSRRRVKDPAEEAFQKETPELGTSASVDNGRGRESGRSRGRSRSRSRSRCENSHRPPPTIDNSLQMLEDAQPRGIKANKSSEYLPMGLYGVGGGIAGDCDESVTSESEGSCASSTRRSRRRERGMEGNSRSRSRSVSRAQARSRSRSVSRSRRRR